MKPTAPNIPVAWYGKFVYSAKPDAKSLKYTCVASCGYYPVMDSLRGKDGLISFFLLESNKSGSKESSSTPPMKLQGKSSLNVTGLRNYFCNGKPSGFAFGYPSDKPTYGEKKPKKNPFHQNNRFDGFLFIFHFSDGKPTPDSFEMLAYKDAKPMIPNYCEALSKGVLNKEIELVRKQAESQSLFS